MSYEEWVRKKIQKRDIKGLVKELKNEDRVVRKAVAKSLDKLGWEPSNDAERTNYLIAAEEWDELAEIGKPAVKPLISCLEKAKEVSVRLNAARTLGKIGDVKAIKPLLSSPYLWSRDEGIWKYYDALVPVVPEGLANIGKGDVQPLIKAVKDALSSGHPIVWALCEIGDRKATEAVVDWIFELGPLAAHLDGRPIVYDNKPMSPVDLIRTKIPPKVLPKLLGDYTDLILDIFAWRPTSEPGKFDVSRCHEAIQRLCMIKTPVSSNILHKVTKVGSLSVSSEWGVEFHTVTYLDFKSQKQMAKEELKRRGKPRYDPSAYLNQDAWRL